MAAVVAQRYVTVRVDDVRPHPRNPREGDVGAIHESITTNGFYGALVVQNSTGYVLAGNHRLEAARAAGITELPAIVVDVDDDRAARILVADNRTNDLATHDNDQLARLLSALALTPDGLAGTGFDGDDLDALTADVVAAAAIPERADDQPTIRVHVKPDVYARWSRAFAAAKSAVGSDSAAVAWMLDHVPGGE